MAYSHRADFVHRGKQLAALAATAAIGLMVALSFGQAEAQSRCGTIQGRIDNASAGSTINLPDGCVYRETVYPKKPVTLIGGPGTEIRGSNVWTNWSRSGSRWVRGTLPSLHSDGRCKPGTSRCNRPAQVFFDGKPLRQVASNPKSGQFAVDGSRRVVLANNPAGHTVEVTTRPYWVNGRSANVTIKGFTMKHAANGAQTGAIRNNGHDNWRVENNNLSYAHGAVVNLGSATGSKIIANNIHHGGQLGISANDAEIEVRGNLIHHNNTEDFDPTWVAGGMKLADSLRVLADGNYVFSNNGQGMWSDVGSQNVTYSNNRVHHNAKQGIHLEITDGGKVFGNVVWENGWGDSSGSDPGIHIVASRNVEVRYNTVAWNDFGISIVNSFRDKGKGATDARYSKVYNVRVHHNTIFSQGRVAGDDVLALQWRETYAGGSLHDSAANNRGYGNRYYFTSSEKSGYTRFLWASRHGALRTFNRTLGEESGSYLPASTKNSIAATKNIPANP